MQGYLQVLAFIIIGIALLWFGFNLFIGQWARLRVAGREYNIRKHKEQRLRDGKAAPDDPQACPLCSMKLYKGELIQTYAYPSITGGKDRLMHIKGCAFCIDGEVKRRCPVCRTSLHTNHFLIARIFERSHKRNHVHILGCCKCKRHDIM